MTREQKMTVVLNEYYHRREKLWVAQYLTSWGILHGSLEEMYGSLSLLSDSELGTLFLAFPFKLCCQPERANTCDGNCCECWLKYIAFRYGFKEVLDDDD